MKRRRTIEETARRQWRKVDAACAGMSAEDVFHYAFRRGWYLSSQRSGQRMRRAYTTAKPR